MRRIRSALGETRDTDVQIDLLESIYRNLPASKFQPGLRRLLLRMRQKRQGLQEKVLDALDQMLESNILEQMTNSCLKYASIRRTNFSKELYQLAFSTINEGLDSFFSYEAYIDQPERVEELHAMRIAAKHLRYSMETFAPLYTSQLRNPIKVLRASQEMLGDVHDCDVWITYLPQFVVEERQRAIDFYGFSSPYKRLLPGIQYFEQDRRLARHQAYQKFLQAWNRWKEERIWDELHSTIEAPTISKMDELSPVSELESKTKVP